MAANTGVEWADDTFNAWWGCTRQSEACRHCYAERFAKRQRVRWGPQAERRPASERTWAQPLAWNRAASRKRRRRRVFCQSMGDVFEGRAELEPLRERLWRLIEQTPMLDWMLLTKLPENIPSMLPRAWLDKPRPNVWLGTTAETQRRADERLSALVQVPAVVRFVSAEPLLGHVDVERWLGRGLGWVIAGGESGAGARALHPDWAVALRDACVRRGVPLFFKQWGAWAPYQPKLGRVAKGARWGWITPDGNWSQSLVRWRPREHAAMLASLALEDGRVVMLHVGKKVSGRVLEGKIWSALPKQAELFVAA